MSNRNWLHKTKSSLTIVLEGVFIATGSLILIVVFVIPYGAIGLTLWSWRRIVDTWADNK